MSGKSPGKSPWKSPGKSPAKSPSQKAAQKLLARAKRIPAWSREETRALVKFLSMPSEGWDPTQSTGWPKMRSQHPLWSKAAQFVQENSGSSILRTAGAVQTQVTKHLNSLYSISAGGRLAAEKAMDARDDSSCPVCRKRLSPVSQGSIDAGTQTEEKFLLPQLPVLQGIPRPEPQGMLSPEPQGTSHTETRGMLSPEHQRMLHAEPQSQGMSHTDPQSQGISHTEPIEMPPPKPQGMSYSELQGMPPPEPQGMSTPIKLTSAIQSDYSCTPSSTWSTPVDKKDQSYQPESESASSATSDVEGETEETLGGHRFIVFGEKIRELFQRCSVAKCGAGTLIRTTTKGTALAVHWTCSKGHNGVWHSQPYIKNQALGNLLVPCAILFSGGSIDKFIDFAESLCLHFVGTSHFFNIQTTFAIPAIDEYFLYQQAMARDLVREGPITIIGDARCDSPGFNAKYSSYTVMEEKTSLILDMQLVQVTETGSSQSMEKEGLERCLQSLEEDDMNIECLATDRHRGVAAMMRKDYKDIKHEFDIFHVSKNVTSKLRTKAKKATCKPLGEWMKSVSNHLWHSCKTCLENPELLREKWTSLLNHIANRHRWSGNKLFHKCAHKPLSRRQQKKTKWLQMGSPAHKALQEVVMDRTLLKDMGKMALFKHTGEIEVYHNVVLKYATKRIPYQYPGMKARLQLSVIDHNENIGRRKATTASGDTRQRLEYSKRQKDFVLKNIYEKKDYSFRRKLLEAVVHKRKTTDVHCGDDVIPRPDLPRSIAPIPRPDMETAKAKHRSRFAD
ncbi:uncharacterized protein LOC118408774 [Branchiostoma floridae]|uniref:Uncharacterized protein LOC118408774 n=1 Tax=Branchiostoma floridae TaxID=7739 RepID=A0A9J7KLU5_BRAFL|nr:uncharacterized protein LOC118408774 [Branchiostoma floridae]XP_035665526.1 uncharacterized protein LOC118408774 [Branchiostoma floridae]XP_035665527.1 uncharacterized protein LOC118408774 [Branchiostoma floridae]